MTPKQRASKVKSWLKISDISPSQFAADINVKAGQMVVQEGTVRKWLNGTRPHRSTLIFIKNAYPECPLVTETRL